MKTFITESELKNRVEKLKAYTDIIAEKKKDKKPLVGDQEELDADKDGDIEGDDLADLRAGKVKEDVSADKKPCPPMSHIKKMCQDGKSVAEICKMHPDCDQKELKQMVADCKKKNESAPIGESVGFCNDDSLVRILAITNRVIK